MQQESLLKNHATRSPNLWKSEKLLHYGILLKHIEALKSFIAKIFMLFFSENRKIHQHDVKFKDKLLPGLISKGLAFHHGKLNITYIFLYYVRKHV